MTSKQKVFQLLPNLKYKSQVIMSGETMHAAIINQGIAFGSLLEDPNKDPEELWDLLLAAAPVLNRYPELKVTHENDGLQIIFKGCKREATPELIELNSEHVLWNMIAEEIEAGFDHDLNK